MPCVIPSHWQLISLDLTQKTCISIAFLWLHGQTNKPCIAHPIFPDAWRWFIISFFFFLSWSFNVDVLGIIDDNEYIPLRETDTVGGRCLPQHAPETFCSIDSTVGGGCTIWSGRWTRHYWTINIQPVPAISLFAVLIFPFFCPWLPELKQ